MTLKELYTLVCKTLDEYENGPARDPESMPKNGYVFDQWQLQFTFVFLLCQTATSSFQRE